MYSALHCGEEGKMAFRRLVVLAAVLLAGSADGATLYTGSPVLRTPPADHTSDSGDYFGYSATGHNTIDFQSGAPSFSERINSGRILVGVPGGTPVNAAVNRTGYVVECPLTPGPCLPMTGTGTGSDLLLYDIRANQVQVAPFNATSEDREGMFLGGTVKSSGGAFMVCGHRYVFEQVTGSVQGYCLVSDRSLRNFQFFNPCSSSKGSSLEITDFSQTVANLRANVAAYTCMAGADLAIDADAGLAISIPAAGGSQRGGAVYSSNIFNGSAGGVYNPAFTVLLYTAQSDLQHQYSGYSVAYARLGGPSSPSSLLMGSPRLGEGFGGVAVVAANFPRDMEGIISEPSRQIGTYFGHSVAAVDLNGDGFDEVVVGAPNYFTSPDIPDIGAFYVYSQTENALSSPVATVRGTGNLRQLGFSLASMGDLNLDGYGDLAVSAPYGLAGTAQEGGTVLIYFGSATGISPSPSQTILGRQLNLMPSLVGGVESFGASLNGDTDVDGNCYRDLVVGAFESRQVFVLRSRSVVIINTTVKASVDVLPISVTGDKSCSFGNQSYDCFDVDYTLAVTGKCLDPGQQFNVSYVFYGDQVLGLASRVFLRNGASEVRSSVTLSLDAPAMSFSERIYIQNPETIYQQAITPTLEAWIPEEADPTVADGNQTLEDLSETRFFSRQNPSPSADMVLGLRECADPSNCSSDLSISAFSLRFDVEDSDGSNTLLLGTATTATFSLTLDVPTTGDNAYGVCTVFSGHLGLMYSSASSVTRGFNSCSGTPTGGTQCCIFSPLLKGIQYPVAVSFSVVDDGFANSSSVAVVIRAELGAGSVDPAPGNNQKTLTFSVAPSTDIETEINFIPSRETVVTDRSRSGLPTAARQLGREEYRVEFTYFNRGPQRVPSGRVEVSIPQSSTCSQQAQGFLYYLSGYASSLACTVSPAGSVNVLNIANSSSTGSGSVVQIDGGCVVEDGTTVQVTCSTPGVQCVTLSCPVTDLAVGQNLSLRVTGYLDEHFYFGTLNHYTLEVMSSFVIDGGIKDPTNNNISSLISVTNPNVFVQSDPVPWWAIVVPIVVAVLAIIALIVILYVCGFFKRRKHSFTPDQEGLTNEAQEGEGNGNGNENENENGNEPKTEGEGDSPADVPTPAADPGVSEAVV